MSTTLVIGAGWAGLSCAYELAKAGHKVQILEAAPQIGGRARSIKFQNQLVDNGQHIALGAYHNMRGLIKELGLEETSLFKILPLEIRSYRASYGTKNKNIRLKFFNLPAPWHLICGVITASNIPWSSKFAILKFAKKIHAINFKLHADCTILELLQNYHQPSFVIEHVWEPIALAAMSTPIDQASAQVFLNILQQTFSHLPTHSNWYLPKIDLSNLLPNYLAQYLQQHGHGIFCNQAIKKIQIDTHTITAYSNTNSWQAERVVLAIPPWQALQLLQEHPSLSEIAQECSKLKYEAITTAYYKFDSHIHLPYPLIGCINTTCQWIFDRSFADQPNILSAVITGRIIDKYPDLTSLKEHIWQEVHRHFTHLPTPTASKIICEKRAAFLCDLHTQSLRPCSSTTIKNLWLCGDYIQTGLPATLEGALLSGKQTAGEILKKC